ncbi:MAG: hypothetical protein QXK77_02130 [Archaeoglobaceae archaeon]
MIFYFLTFFAILFSEKATKIVSEKFFSNYIREIEKEEEKIVEFEELSILALISGEKEAYKGFQQMMGEIYTKIFFKRLAFLTPLFFLILSPYLILVELLEIGNPTTVIAIALLYFSFKIALSFLKQNYELWKAQKLGKQLKY